MNSIAAAINAFLLVYAGLFPIVNPIGSAPIFLRLTQPYAGTVRQALARGVAINSFALLLGSLFIGSHVLEFFGITLPIVRIAGGLVVAALRLAAASRQRRFGRPPQRRGKHARRVDRCVLSPDHAADGRTGLDFRRDHARQSATGGF